MENFRQRIFLTGFSSIADKTAVLFTQEVELTPDGPILKQRTEYIKDQALAEAHPEEVSQDRQAFSDAVNMYM